MPSAPVTAYEGAAESRSALDFNRVLMLSVVSIIAVVVAWQLEPLLLFRPAEGVVLRSTIERTRMPSGRGAARVHYSPRVFYRYEVGGATHVGFRYHRSSILGMSFDADRVARLHDSGKPVRVWYSPLDPSYSVLTRRPDWYLFGCLAMMVLVLAKGWRDDQRRRRLDDVRRQIFARRVGRPAEPVA